MGKSSVKNIYCKTFLALAVCVAAVMAGCGSVPDAAGEEPAALPEAVPPAETADPHYRYAGMSAITVKPGRARTIAVSYHSDGEAEADDSRYVWTAADPSVVSIRGMGNKCAVVGKREGSTLVVVTNPDIPLPYAFQVICTADEAVGRSFQKTRSERTEGRLVGGWSNLEMVESRGE